jgi:hypothetical protein
MEGDDDDGDDEQDDKIWMLKAWVTSSPMHFYKTKAAVNTPTWVANWSRQLDGYGSNGGAGTNNDSKL